MRLIIVLLLSVGLGQMAHMFNPALGGNLTLFIFIIFGAIPYSTVAIRSNSFKREIESWALKNNIEVASIKNLFLFKGKLFWKSSDVQDIFLLKSDGVNYWVACGSWFFGSFSKRLTIYEESNGNLKMIDCFKI